MAIDNKTESSAVMNFLFPFVMFPFIEGTFGPEESSPLLGTYGEAAAGPVSPTAARNILVPRRYSMRIGP